MPLRNAALALVLATLTLPAAVAVGEEAFDTVRDIQSEAHSLARDVDAFVEPLLPRWEEPRQEEAAREREQADHPGRDEPAPAERSEPSAPRESPGRSSSPLAPVTRLLPIPFTDVGPAPVLDITSFARDVTTPLAPPPAPYAPAPSAVTPLETSAEVVTLQPSNELATTVALGVAAAATATVPAAASLWERLRRPLGASGGFALLYSRIAKERILDHNSREELLAAIRAKPGLAVADLAIAASLPRNTVTYHLRVLEREGLVSSTRNGRNRLYFAPGSLEKRDQAGALATLRHEKTLAMARAIGAEPGVDQKALCAVLGVSPSLAHWHADRLVASGVVDRRREGRSVRYYPGTSFSVVPAHSA